MTGDDDRYHTFCQQQHDLLRRVTNWAADHPGVSVRYEDNWMDQMLLVAVAHSDIHNQPGWFGTHYGAKWTPAEFERFCREHDIPVELITPV